jgi:signal transduction histidine kinase
MKRVSPVAWLVSVASVLIAAFVTSTVLVERNNSRLDEVVAQISNDAAPSITELAAARTEMRRLELGVGRYLGSRTAGLPFDSSQLGRWRAAVDQHLDAYSRLPSFPEERPIFEEMARAKQRVYDDIDRITALLDDRRTVEARAIALGALDRDADELDTLNARLINLNNDYAFTSARDIGAQRRRSSLLAIALDASSIVLGAVLLLAAVRAARLYHRALDERRRLAEARALELDHFAARVAHDLKAPLASVVLGTSVAAEYPEEATRALQKIQRASRLMGQMIDALLAVARVEPEGQHAPATPVAPVLDILVDEVRPAATSVEATLQVEPFSASATVACSAGVLASVLSNLLHNAVKYIGDAAGERRVVVRVSDKGAMTRFEVEDSGPGLPPELEEHVFEAFVKGDKSSGLGLGLATVKRLVDSSGGRLGVSSSPGRGSCFWVELPRAADDGHGRVAS